MITPKVISIQEIKLAQTKTKITDMVAVRHPLSNGDYRTTLIILCEDGSLRMFLAAKEHTGNILLFYFKIKTNFTNLYFLGYILYYYFSISVLTTVLFQYLIKN